MILYRTLVIGVCWILFNPIFAHIYPVDLDTRIDQATQITIAQVVDKHSYWNEEGDAIYTSYKMKVVCYAKNPQGKWICYNDSSCKEVSENEIDLESAYLLFYERKGLDTLQYLPNVSGRTPQPLTQLDSEVEAEYKKQCNLM